MNHIIYRRLPVYALMLLFTISVNAQKRNERPTNIILMIGDGMGVAQVYSGYTANKGQLNLFRCNSIGFSKTYSASDYITDSGAGATAISTGYKTYNGAIGVDKDTVIAKAMGSHIMEGLNSITRLESDAFRLAVHPWELDRYLATY